MYTKASIFNLALGALLLQRQIIDTATDKSNECKVLNTHWDAALVSTLADLDLDSTSTTATLTLITADPNDDWDYVYQYPTSCAFFRRIKSTQVVDNRTSHIPKLVQMRSGVKVIYTDEEAAVAEYIPSDIGLNTLSAEVGLAIAYKLAILSAPLVTGKGARQLIADIEKKYLITKAQAQEHDRRENFNFVDETIESEFVEARLS